MKQLIMLIALFGFTTFGFSQQSTTHEDVIYLINGGVIRGKIVENTEQSVKIEILGGSLLVYAREEILTIKREKIKRNKARKPSIMKNKDEVVYEPGPLDENGEPDHGYQYKNEGKYFNIMLGMMPGSGQFGDFAFGGSAQFSAGYHFNRFLGVGLGVGSDSYIDDDVRNLFPIFAEVKGFLLDNPVSPYYNIGIGYSLATVTRGSDFINMTDASGGIFINPRIGVRFPSKVKTSFVMDVGYIYQKATFEFDNFQGRFRDDVTYNRP